MSPLRRVAAEQAGPAALGILVPPGRRTFVILRPRALELDLLVTRSLPVVGSSAFLDVGRQEAACLAEALFQALEAWACGGPGRVEVVALDGGAHGIRVHFGTLPLLACPRQPGQPYQPLAHARIEEARQQAAALATALRPAENAEREVYFNTLHFAH